jgi:hypothetical protein
MARSVYEERGVVLLDWIPDPQDQPYYVEGELVNMTAYRTLATADLLR